MKTTVTEADIFVMVEHIRMFQWGQTVQNAAQNHAFRLIGLKTDSTEPHERFAPMADMLHGDLTARQAMKKLGIAIVPTPEPKPKRTRKRVTRPEETADAAE